LPNPKKIKRMEYSMDGGEKNLTPPSQPKARFYTRINEQDYLGITVWPGKADPSAEVITLQLRRRDGDNWETVGRLAVYRSPDGTYSKLPERQG
jgi:hypothetical protein